MKNLHLLPEDLRDRITHSTWHCGCGQKGLRYSVTRKGKIQAHCFNCGDTIFWNDINWFYTENPFGWQTQKYVAKVGKKSITRWYPKARVRIFSIRE